MVRKDIVVSALEALTSEEFEPSDFADNSAYRRLYRSILITMV